MKRQKLAKDGQFIQQVIFIAGITLENWQTWFTIIGIGCGLIWALYQYNKNRKEKQQEKAAEIAKEFANGLIERMGIVSAVLMANIDIKEMIETIAKSKKLSQFTTLEIIKILSDKKCFEKFKTILHSDELQNNYSNFINIHYTDVEKEKFESKFILLLESTLNRLEAICINISSQAAGSQFIYNSLHQSFFYNVEVLSLFISSSNTNNVDKYYTNIITVYNMWNKLRKKDIQKLDKTKKKVEKLHSKAEKEITKLLSKKNETV